MIRRVSCLVPTNMAALVADGATGAIATTAATTTMAGETMDTAPLQTTTTTTVSLCFVIPQTSVIPPLPKCAWPLSMSNLALLSETGWLSRPVHQLKLPIALQAFEFPQKPTRESAF